MKSLSIILITFLALVNACSNKNISNAETESTMKQETEEVKDISSIWILETINGSKIENDKIFLDIKMNDLSFSGKSFCNSIFGKLVMDNKSKIKFTNMGMTMMACNEDLMAMENEYNSIIRKVTSYKIKKDLLSLYDYDGKLALQYRYSDTKVNVEDKGEYLNEKSPLIRLNDIWGLKKMNGMEVDMTKGMILEMNTKEMTFSGFASCNRMFGSLVSINENELKLENIGSTRKLCPDMTTENEYMSSLKKVSSYQIKGLKLYFLDASENVLFEYIKID